ncbi:MAG TPA: protein-glutamate O-methyltransferase CheR [Anaeromyxobacteraceae bacterium]|nr:protein-glutamate O-methyltransferase CheR [Anaeromyxobacteraceae bacterium]
MTPASFRAFQEIAYAQAGIHLREGKAALVQARLAKRLRELGLQSEEEYLGRLRGQAARDEIVLFLDAISTNFTKFFREPDHFELLQDDVAAASAAGQHRFRFWCAGCASGEEPYTVAMTVHDRLATKDWKILATDLSTRALARARAGVYGDEEIADVPARYRERFLTRARGADGSSTWTVSPRLRERIVFRRLNLSQRPYPMSGPLDAVFCRNVMIYFDRPMRAGLVAEIERLVKPGGRFFIGHSETLNGIDTGLLVERPSVYRKRGEAR